MKLVKCIISQENIQKSEMEPKPTIMRQYIYFLRKGKNNLMKCILIFNLYISVKIKRKNIEIKASTKVLFLSGNLFIVISAFISSD